MSGTQPNNDTMMWGRVQRLLAGALRLSDSLPAILRSDTYGEPVIEMLTSKQHKFADEGSYFFTRTPTVGTGIIQTVSTAFSDTQPYIIVVNNNPVPNAGAGRSIYLDYIKLLCTNAGATETQLAYTTRLDQIATRYTSGGSGSYGTQQTSVLQGPFPLNPGSPANSSALIYAGAITTAAGSPQVRTVSSGWLRTAIPVVNDQYFLNFGTADMPLDGTLVSGTNIAQRAIPHPPVCIPPQCTFLLHLWGASMGTGPQFEIEIGHVER